MKENLLSLADRITVNTQSSIRIGDGGKRCISIPLRSPASRTTRT